MKLGEGYISTGICVGISDSVHRGSASVHTGIPPSSTSHVPHPTLDQAPPGQGTPRQGIPRTRHSLSTEHAGRYSQRMGGTHPTEMQSCYYCYYYSKQVTALHSRDDQQCLD